MRIPSRRDVPAIDDRAVSVRLDDTQRTATNEKGVEQSLNPLSGAVRPPAAISVEVHRPTQNHEALFFVVAELHQLLWQV